MTQSDSGFSSSNANEFAIPDIYTDSVRINMSVYGVCFELGLNQPFGPVGSDGTVITRPEARVYMSPQHAKVLALTLLKNIRAYEDQVGEINLPQELLRDLDIEEGGK
ncbi:DUF3467 domain-containing protein [Nitrolancea hollandica]|nr:DUF3467 domain-containing protein [Nitrolancea hollandica]